MDGDAVEFFFPSSENSIKLSFSPSARRSSGRAMISTGAVAVKTTFSGVGHDGHFLSWGGLPTRQPAEAPV